MPAPGRDDHEEAGEAGGEGDQEESVAAVVLGHQQRRGQHPDYGCNDVQQIDVIHIHFRVDQRGIQNLISESL